MHRWDRARIGLIAGTSVLGLAISAYLTAVHAAAAPLVCNTGGMIANCELVLSSPYASIAGTGAPTALAGIAWFGVSALLAGVQLARPSEPSFLLTHAAWAAVGLAVVIYLVFVEIVVLGAICLWCTAAHVLVLVTFSLVVTRWYDLSRYLDGHATPG